MRIFNIFIILIFLSSSVFSKEIVARFGFMTGVEALSDFKYVRASLLKLIKRIAGEHARVHISFYSNKFELYENLKEGTLDIIGMNAYDFFSNENKFLPYIKPPYWSLSYTNENKTKYCLISNKNVKLNNYKILKNHIIALKNQDQVAYQWLNKNSLEHYQTNIENISKNIIYLKKESTIVLNVFFNKYDFGVVKKVTLDTMIELNPTIKKKLNILSCSKYQLIPFIGFFHKRTFPKKNVEVFFKLTSNFKDSVAKDVSLVLNFNHVYKLNEKQMSSLRAFYRDYATLKK